MLLLRNKINITFSELGRNGISDNFCKKKKNWLIISTNSPYEHKPWWDCSKYYDHYMFYVKIKKKKIIPD